jgi:hypothetical protein
MSKRYYSLYLLFVLGFSSCIYHGEKSDALIYRTVNDDGTILSRQTLPANAKHNFENLFKFIIKPKCLSCHSGNEPDDDIDLSTYSNIINHPYYYLVVPGSPLDSSLFISINNDDMPSDTSPLSSAEKQFIRKWIELNAPEK